MTLFNESDFKRGNVNIAIKKVWFFWVCDVTYSGNFMLNSFMFSLTRANAIEKAKKATLSIMKYEEKMGYVNGT